jgi:hypothetical protein
VASGVIVLASVLLFLDWYQTPTGLYNAAKFGPVWQEAVNKELVGSSPKPTFLAGVGALVNTFVATPDDGAHQVDFWPSSNPDHLIYLSKISDSWTLQDQCTAHISGHWFQTAPLNGDTMSCPRGYRYIPGG